MRRSFMAVLTVVTIIPLLLVSACVPVAAPPAAAPTEAAPAEAGQPDAAPAGAEADETGGVGGTLTVLIHPTLYEVTGGEGGWITRFAEENGVEVEVVTAPSNDLREKVLIEGSAGSGRFDMYVVQDAWLNEDLAQYLEPLDERFSNVEADYRPDDLNETLVNAYRSPRGSGALYAIPFRVGTAMLYYRADLLEEAGIETPKNWEEFLAAAEQLTQDKDNDGRTDVYGLAQDLYPGGRSLLRVMYAHGAEMLSADESQCLANSPEGVAALDMLAAIYQNGWVDKESLAWERDAVIGALQQGRGAMTINYSPYWGRLIDPEGGEGAEHMGWAVVPTSPGVPEGRTINDGWGWAIDKNSQNKETAWELVKLLTGPEAQLDMALNYANGPVRNSVYESEEYLGEFPLAKDWLVATSASDFMPAHPRYAEMQDILNEEGTNAYLGQKTAQQALDDACSRIDLLLD